MMRVLYVAVAVFAFLVVPTISAEPPRAATNDVRWQDLPFTDTVFKAETYASVDQWKVRRTWLQGQVRLAAGLWPEPQRTPMNARIFGKLECEGYTIEKVYFESFPGFYVTGNLYRPRNVEGKVPAVACPHGHWEEGRLHHTEGGSVPARCITLARLGAVVFAYDMIGWNDAKKQIVEHDDQHLNSAANALWGIGTGQLQTWNSVRVLDFLQSLPEVDGQRMGATGASGGGTQTFLLSAIDDRVKVTAPVNMISGLMQGGCVCENPPCLRLETNNMELGALFAPRPMLMISTSGDWTKNTPTLEYPMIRGVYELYGAADHVANYHFDYPHNYNAASRRVMYRFFAKWLLNRDDADTVEEGEIKAEKPEDMLVFAEEDQPKNMLSVPELVEQLRAAVDKKIESFQPTNKNNWDELARVVRFGVRHMAATNFPSADEVIISSGGIYHRNHRPVHGQRFWSLSSARQTDSFTICVHPDGLAAAEQMKPFINQRLEHDECVMFIEPFGTGQCKPPTDLRTPRGTTNYFTTFNRTDAAETVFDIVTVLAAELQNPRMKMKQINLVGFGRLGPVCLLARALVPDELVGEKRLRTVIDMNAFDIDDDAAYLEHLNLPNIRRIGGLRAIAAVAANGPIWFHNTGEDFDVQWIELAAKVNGVQAKVSAELENTQRISDWLNLRE